MNMYFSKDEAPLSPTDPNAELEQLASQLDEPVEPYIRKHRKRKQGATPPAQSDMDTMTGKQQKANMSDEQLNLLRLKINSRERRRMHDLNSAMDALRSSMPHANGSDKKSPAAGGSRKLSKISTLLLAKKYIESLMSAVAEMEKLCEQAGKSEHAKAIVQAMLLEQTTEFDRRTSSDNASSVTPQPTTAAKGKARGNATGTQASGSSGDDAHSRRSSTSGGSSEPEACTNSHSSQQHANNLSMSVSRLLAQQGKMTNRPQISATAAPPPPPPPMHAASALGVPAGLPHGACLKLYLGAAAPCACDRCCAGASAWHVALSQLAAAAARPLYAGVPHGGAAALAAAGLLAHRDAGVTLGAK